MKPTPREYPRGLWWRSLLAMFMALGSLLIVLGVVVYLYDAAVDPANWLKPRNLGGALFLGAVVSAFAIVGWLLVVLPLTFFKCTRGWLTHRYGTELVWAGLGVLSFNVMFQPFEPNWGIVIISWIPALIGTVAGSYFRLLTRRHRQGQKLENLTPQN